MAYNEIEVNGNLVQGHKFAGATTLLDAEVTYSSNGSKTYTMTADGLFGLTLRCTPTGAGNSITINGTTAVNAYMGSTNIQQTGTWLVPVKKGDVVVVVYNNGPGWLRTQFIAYR